jgi:hypothetical protein
MLDKLNAIDWQSLNAEKLPKLINAMFSEDAETQLRAYMRMYEYLRDFIQDWREYEEVLATDALIYAAPFFVEFLHHPQTHKASILGYLDVLARYHQVKELEEPFRGRALRIYEYLLQHFDAYIPYLDSTQAEERTKAMYLLSKFEEKSAWVAARLLQRIDQDVEEDEWGKIVSVECIYMKIQDDGLLASQFSARFIRVLQRWVSNAVESVPVKATAAEYLLYLLGDGVESTAISAIITALSPEQRDNSSIFADVLFHALVRFGGKHAIDALLRILDEAQDTWTIFMAAGALLQLGFKNRKVDRIYVNVDDYFPDSKIKVEVNLYNEIPLSQQQRIIISHLLTKNEIWQAESNLMSLAGLPQNRFDVKVWLDTH